MIVEFLPRARQRIRVIAAWWRKNRTITPTLFDEELADLTERLKRRPFLGIEHEIVDGEMIRKTQLRRTAQNVYYSVDEANGVIYSTRFGERADEIRSCEMERAVPRQRPRTIAFGLRLVFGRGSWPASRASTMRYAPEPIGA